jgi:hypothetical protein
VESNRSRLPDALDFNDVRDALVHGWAVSGRVGQARALHLGGRRLRTVVPNLSERHCVAGLELIAYHCQILVVEFSDDGTVAKGHDVVPALRSSVSHTVNGF